MHLFGTPLPVPAEWRRSRELLRYGRLLGARSSIAGPRAEAPIGRTTERVGERSKARKSGRLHRRLRQ